MFLLLLSPSRLDRLVEKVIHDGNTVDHNSKGTKNLEQNIYHKKMKLNVIMHEIIKYMYITIRSNQIYSIQTDSKLTISQTVSSFLNSNTKFTYFPMNSP